MLYKRAISLVGNRQGSTHGYRRMSKLFFFLFLYTFRTRNIIRALFVLTVSGLQALYHGALGLVATCAMAYDCIVVRAYACCHLSRYIISVVFCSLIPSVVSASLNSQYN